jgi:hypothetical protein
MIARQLGAMLVATFVFFAFVAAMTRLLRLKETPFYIDNLSKALANLYKGVFAR